MRFLVLLLSNEKGIAFLTSEMAFECAVVSSDPQALGNADPLLQDFSISATLFLDLLGHSKRSGSRQHRPDCGQYAWLESNTASRSHSSISKPSRRLRSAGNRRDRHAKMPERIQWIRSRANKCSSKPELRGRSIACSQEIGVRTAISVRGSRDRSWNPGSQAGGWVRAPACLGKAAA